MLASTSFFYAQVAPNQAAPAAVTDSIHLQNIENALTKTTAVNSMSNELDKAALEKQQKEMEKEQKKLSPFL